MLLADLQVAEQTHQIESLKAKQTGQQLLLVSQRRWIAGFAASSMLLERTTTPHAGVVVNAA